jgi:hypothetical protein
MSARWQAYAKSVATARKINMTAAMRAAISISNAAEVRIAVQAGSPAVNLRATDGRSPRGSRPTARTFCVKA